MKDGVDSLFKRGSCKRPRREDRLHKLEPGDATPFSSSSEAWGGPLARQPKDG